MSDYISEDNLFLILKYLPVKSLLRYRSVCKGWKQLIDSPTFVLDHLSVQSPAILFQNGRGRDFVVVDTRRPRHSVKPLNRQIPRHDFFLFGTLHGIVCLFNLVHVMLWNPSIRKISTFYAPNCPIPDFVARGKLQLTYGFWISPSTKEFKIIFIQRRPAVKCFLYSSVGGDWGVIPIPKKVESWKSCKAAPPVMIVDVGYWGGCLDEHVDSLDLDYIIHEHENKAILSFDFVQECFEIFELCNPDDDEYSRNEHGSPDVYSMENYNATPFRWKDKLSLVCWTSGFPHKCKIFLRSDNSWVGMFHFELCDNLVNVFWAMEDLERVNKRGKGKRKREEGAEENVRILATFEIGCEYETCDLVLEGTRSGTKTVKKGLDYETDVIVVHDFVESLLFP